MNTSGKVVTAYGLSVIHKYADGTTGALPDGQPSGSSSEEMLDGWISAEMRKGRPIEGSIDSVGFAPEAVKCYTQPMLKDVVDAKATIDYVICADCTAEVQIKLACAWAASSGKGELVGLQRVSEIIKQALADPAVSDPVATARVEFERLFSIQARKGRTMSMDPESQPEPEPDPQALRNAISDLDSFPAINSNLTPGESLDKYLAETEKHSGLLLPHTQITATSEK